MGVWRRSPGNIFKIFYMTSKFSDNFLIHFDFVMWTQFLCVEDFGPFSARLAGGPRKFSPARPAGRPHPCASLAQMLLIQKLMRTTNLVNTFPVSKETCLKYYLELLTRGNLDVSEFEKYSKEHSKCFKRDEWQIFKISLFRNILNNSYIHLQP